MKVAKGDVSPTVTADGLITAKTTVNISSQVMGEITALPFEEGQRVKKGDVLVQINPDTYQRDVASAKSNLEAAQVAARQADVTYAQRKLDWIRAKDLFDKKIFSPSSSGTTPSSPWTRPASPPIPPRPWCSRPARPTSVPRTTWPRRPCALPSTAW